ncbi:DUF5681 domain-containing protein [Nitrobacteraceae bacterium UC4446_H13]
MSRSRNNGAPGSDRDPFAPRARKPKTQADPTIVPDGDAPGADTDERRNNASAASRDADYKVGYGRPPRQSQFKPGESGNPRGRPKGVRSEDDILAKLLNKKIPIQDRGRIRYVSMLEAGYYRVAQNALKGDLKAMNFLMHRKAAVAQTRSGETPEMNEDDRVVLESFVAQIINSQQNGGGK